MGRNKPAKIRNGRDVTRLLEKEGCEIRMGKGSHRVARLPNGQTLTYYEHGDFPPGIRSMIVKILKLAGFAVTIYLVLTMCGMQLF
jgi:predicted RNA binding protein YcfA (HicA-like mRNA interferase family)